LDERAILEKGQQKAQPSSQNKRPVEDIPLTIPILVSKKAWQTAKPFGGLGLGYGNSSNNQSTQCESLRRN
jgi:hypothetical protein